MNCKKCGKPLPAGHKGNLCEHCKGQKAHTAKNALKTAVGTIFAVAVVVITNGKINPGNK